MTAKRKRIVVVGGGVAGLELATLLGRRSARDARFEVTLVDLDTAHVWKPMLHAIAAGTGDGHRGSVPFVEQARRNGFAFAPGEIEGLDRTRRLVHLAALKSRSGRVILDARELPYDVLVLAVGSRANDFGTPGVAEHCHVIDTRHEADSFNLDIRAAILRCIVEGRFLRIAIVGGGATGVQLAAELVHLMDAAAAYGVSDLRQKVAITLLDGGPRLLPAFPEHVSAGASSKLAELGVEVRHGAHVAEATESGFVLNGGETVPASVRVWAAGIIGPMCLSRLDGLAISRSRQIVVRPTLQTETDEAVFALGDCASLTPEGAERPCPATAQIAHQQARHLAGTLPNYMGGGSLGVFRPRDFGSLVSLGPYGAYGSLGRFGLMREAPVRGRLAQAGHALLYRSHQARLFGFWRGTIVWLIDQLARAVAPRVRVD